MDVVVEAEIKELENGLVSLYKRQIPYAAKEALNDTAWDVRRDQMRRMPYFIDRPTPGTVKAFKVTKATKRKLVAVTEIVKHKWRYLKWTVLGGTRRPRGFLTLPVQHRLNKYGNIPALRRKKPLWGRRQPAAKGQFVANIKGTEGIWKVIRGKLTLLVAMRQEADYQPSWPFRAIGRRTINSKFYRNMVKTLNHAIKTAK